MTKKQVFGISFDDMELDRAVDAAIAMIDAGKPAYVVTPNPEIVMAAQKDPALLRAIKGAELVLPDGVGVLLAAAAAGCRIRHRVPGIDFASRLMQKLAQRGGSVYLLGAEPGVSEAAAGNLCDEHTGLRVLGMHHGYYSPAEEKSIRDDIRTNKPDLILVCLGSPKQELWMAETVRQLTCGLMIGLGGALDVYAGRLRRAPALLRRIGLEWLYRLALEPARFSRVIRLPRIFAESIRYRTGRKRNEQR